jgi:hypothetical protein
MDGFARLTAIAGRRFDAVACISSFLLMISACDQEPAGHAEALADGAPAPDATTDAAADVQAPDASGVDADAASTIDASDADTSAEDVGDAGTDASALDAAEADGVADVADASDATTDAADTGAADADAADPDADAGDAGPPPEPWAPPEPDGCNGWTALCDRPFDQVAFATTHNAMSSEEDGFFAPNQKWNVTHQLEDGIRGLMLDVHYDKGDVYLCHGYCIAGQRLLVLGLADIRAFLDTHPREVVTVIFESYVTAADTEAAFIESGLLAYAHVQDPAAPWPTLQQMIDSGHRLVVLTDHEGHTLPWYMDVWDHAFETHYHFESPEELSCDPNRGSPDNALFILNHFLTSPLASPELADQINHDPLFLDRAQTCQSEGEHLPNFVTVDFYDIGDVFGVVNALNGQAF